MKNNHIQTAIKALKRQLDKYIIEREKFEVAELNARESKEFFAKEILRLEKQVQQLEGTEIKEPQLNF